jgi:hypothetical protein
MFAQRTIFKNNKETKDMKLKPIALGVAAGVLWGGVCVFLTTLLSVYTGYGKSFLEAIPESVYPGYSITLAGSFAGLVYGFIDGFICGVIFAWVYNKVAGV